VGKVVVVTGGASGIGKGTVQLFAEEGATVILGDIDADAGQEIANNSTGNVLFKRCDVCQDGDVKALMDFAAEQAGGIDIVFNNAGAVGDSAPIDEIDMEGWNHTMALLLGSVAMGIRHAVPHMKKRGGGSIVNTASICALQAGFGPVAYSTAKAGVLHMSKCAAADLAQHKIRVNAICPGFIMTNIFSSGMELEGEDKANLEGWMGQTASTFQPVQKVGDPRDIAEAVAYFSSDAGAFVTGTHLVVDGGITIGPRSSWDPETPGLFAEVMPDDQ